MSVYDGIERASFLDTEVDMGTYSVDQENEREIEIIRRRRNHWPGVSWQEHMRVEIHDILVGFAVPEPDTLTFSFEAQDILIR